MLLLSHLKPCIMLYFIIFFFFYLLLASYSLALSISLSIYEDNNKYRMKSVYLNKIECKINNLMYMFLKSGCVE